MDREKETKKKNEMVFRYFSYFVSTLEMIFIFGKMRFLTILLIFYPLNDFFCAH